MIPFFSSTLQINYDSSQLTCGLVQSDPNIVISVLSHLQLRSQHLQAALVNVLLLLILSFPALK